MLVGDVRSLGGKRGTLCRCGKFVGDARSVYGGHCVGAGNAVGFTA